MPPRGNIRIIYHADGHPWESHIPLYPKSEDLHEFVDYLAEAEVDIMSMMGFVGGDTVWKTNLAFPRYSKHPLHEPARLRLERLWAQGVEPIDVYARRCHEKGMKFLVKFRMNDRHHEGILTGHYNIHMGKFIQDHQKWWLKDYPGGFDYTHQGVRDWMFSLAHDVTSRFDIDGLTFNYIRYPYVFERAESRKKMPILTEFMRRVRRMLDEEGKKKGRKLHFCVIVAPTIEECFNFGLDVVTWIEEEIVDSVCPCHFDNTLFNAPYEEFAGLTRKKNVYLFPTVHPGISPYLYYFGFMTQPAYRAAARNIYAAGADGISTFNYMNHWWGRICLWGAGSRNGGENYPGALYFLKELRSEKDLEKRDRHYLYWRSRDMSHYPGFLDRFRVAALNRSQGARAELVIRCAEMFDSGTKALVCLNAANLLPGDEIEVAVNDKTIPNKDITRTFHKDGRTNLQEGIKLPAYTTITFTPASPPFKFLTNRLTFTLLKSGEGNSGEITVPEIEIAVSEGEHDPLEVISLMKDGPYPEPMKTLAGYHPDLMEVAKEIMVGNKIVDNEYIGARCFVKTKEGVTTGAQSFVLEKNQRITRVELCVYRIPEIQAPLCLSLRADKNGMPANEPINKDAVSVFDPWENSEELLAWLPQGYYKFIFEKPLSLTPGIYWLVIEMDPHAQPASSVRWGDPPSPSCYTLLLTANAWKQYPQGRYMTWNGDRWRQVEKDGEPVNSLFSVLGE